jgi:hypothetical protein
MGDDQGKTLAKAVAAYQQLIALLESVPYCLLAIPLRLAVATVFWYSGQTND